MSKIQEAYNEWNAIAGKTELNSIPPTEVGGAGYTTAEAIDELKTEIDNSVQNAVSYSAQTKTDAQQAQARSNIGAGTVTDGDLDGLRADVDHVFQNLKTINNQSILGPGNIVITGDGSVFDDVIYGTWVSDTEFNDTDGNAVVLVENKLYVDELTNERYAYLDNVLVSENISNEFNYDGKITIDYLQDSYPDGSAETNGKLAYNTSTNKLVNILYDENSGINTTINISLNKHTIYIWENKVYVWNGISLMQIGVLSDYIDNSVSYSTQIKTEEEQKIARENINAQENLIIWENPDSLHTSDYYDFGINGIANSDLTFNTSNTNYKHLIVFMSGSGNGDFKLTIDGYSKVNGIAGLLLDGNSNVVGIFERENEDEGGYSNSTLKYSGELNSTYTILINYDSNNQRFYVYPILQYKLPIYTKTESNLKFKTIQLNTLTINRSDAIWENDLLRLLTGMISNRILSDVELKVRNSYGDINPDFKIVYNDNKAYLSCKEVTKNNNWDFITIKYNLSVNDKTYIPDLRGKIGKNYLQDESSGHTSHSDFNAELFRSFYEVIGENKREILKSLNIKGDTIYQTETDEYAVKYKFNLVSRPYVSGATSEEYSSCPDILTVASHYDNTNTQHNITADANTFLKNTIAVSAGANLDGTGNWTSYGYGVEFFEAFGEFLTKYPDEIYKNFYGGVFQATIDSDKRTIHLTNSNLSLPYKAANQLSVGSTVWLHYPDTSFNSNSKIIFKIDSIIDNTTIVSDRYLVKITDATTTDFYSYINIFKLLYYSGIQQSPTCSVVSSKFAAIQDKTDANWQLVREAARMTASNSTYTTNSDGLKVWTTNWDMKRGFGVIDVDLAVEYIEQWYSNNQAYKDSSQPHLEKGNLLLGYDDINDDNYITKKMITEQIGDIQTILESI